MTKHKIDGMLLATFLTTIFYSSTYPYIHKEIISVVSDNLIAINQIINCLSIVIFGYIWNKSEKIFKYYPAFCIVETACAISLSAFVILTDDIVAYYILDALIFSIITRNICCGGIRLRALRYHSEKDRKAFDNNDNSVAAIATIIGSCIAIGLKLPFNTMIIIATVGNCIDNIFYIFIYYKSKLA